MYFLDGQYLQKCIRKKNDNTHAILSNKKKHLVEIN